MNLYLVSLLTFFFIILIAGLSQNIMTGYAGQPVLCTMALVGIGAYTTALLMLNGYSFWLSLVIAPILAAIISLALAALTIRLKEDYLALASIGLNYLLVSIWLFTPQFGGFSGLFGLPKISIAEYKLNEAALLGLAVIITAVLYYVKWRLVNSSLGLALKAVGGNELAARACGINVIRIKILAVVIGSMYAAIAGCFFAAWLRAIHPWNFHFVHSVEVFTIPLLGGPGTIVGPLVGTAIYVFIPEIFRFATDIRILVFALALLLIVLFQPSGLLGKDSYLRRLILRKLTAGSEKKL